MATASIPVDPFNPGQVFASLGFIEAADALLGDAEGGFDWNHEPRTTFTLRTAGEPNPIEVVLGFLAQAEFKAVAPRGWKPKEKPVKPSKDEKERNKQERAKAALEAELSQLVRTTFFPAPAPETTAALPIQMCAASSDGVPPIILGHWADSNSGRTDFKLYSGNRSALGIAKAMIEGTRAEPRKGQNIGDLKTKGFLQLWEEDRDGLIRAPFDVLTPMGGSFNFDPRGGWTAIDAGYSPNEHDHDVQASPLVEILAALGLEHARPLTFGVRQVRYAVWGAILPPILARAALGCDLLTVPSRRFHFELGLSGKNKVVTYAQEEPTL